MKDNGCLLQEGGRGETAASEQRKQQQLTIQMNSNDRSTPNNWYATSQGLNDGNKSQFGAHGAMQRPLEQTGAKPVVATARANLDSRIRLLQSKLHPFSIGSTGQQDEEYGSTTRTSRQTANVDPQSDYSQGQQHLQAVDRLSVDRRQLEDAESRQVEEDEGDSLSLCSSLASSSSSTASSTSNSSSSSSSSAPTPPPRLSSLRQSASKQAYLPAQQAAANNHLPIAHQVVVGGASSGPSEQAAALAAAFKRARSADSYSNQLVPTRTSLSSQKVNSQHLQQISTTTTTILSRHQLLAPHSKQQHQHQLAGNPRGAGGCFPSSQMQLPMTTIPSGQPSSWMPAGSRTPLTKAMQELVNGQQGQHHHLRHHPPQSLHVVNTPASRRPINAAIWDKPLPPPVLPAARQLYSSSPSSGKLPSSNVHLISDAIQQRPQPVLDSSANNNNHNNHKIADNSVQLLVAQVAREACKKDAKTSAGSENSISNSASHLLIMEAAAQDKQLRPSELSRGLLSSTTKPSSSISNTNNNHCDITCNKLSGPGSPAKQNDPRGSPSRSAATPPDTRRAPEPEQGLAGTIAGVKAGRRVSPTTSSCSQALEQRSAPAEPLGCAKADQQSTGEPGEQQRLKQQRQLELLQLMRLRQVQRQQQAASNAMNEAAGSHELPTLEQLQQSLRSVSQKSHGPHQWELEPSIGQAEEEALLESVVLGPQQRPQQQQPQPHRPQLQQPLSALLDERPRIQATQMEMEQPMNDAGAQLHLHKQQQDTLTAAAASSWTGKPDGSQANLTTTTSSKSPQNMTTSTRVAPTASERLQRHSPISTGQLSILTTNLQPTKPQLSLESSAQSTPANSVLSDSTTLTTEAAMNSAELIPKLIERLDRKLVVMKDEQLSLMREIELNECNGRRLFESMERHLTAGELDKVNLHATEIEKVTKLILSLKLRLKRVEVELKERVQRRPLMQHQQQQQQQTIPAPANADSSHNNENMMPTQTRPASSAATCGDHQQHQHQHKQVASQTVVRGVSDPTSTGGLPKRNHQHHASLQTAGSEPTSDLLDRPAVEHKEEVLLKPAFNDSNEALREEEETDEVGKTTSSTSRDSIFNCDDSAIGSTITGHGGSATNIGQNHQQATTCSQSSLVSSHCSSFNSSTANHHHHTKLRFEGGSPSQSNLFSSISVSSHSSSVSSVPNSPPLVSPVEASQSVDLPSTRELQQQRQRQHSSCVSSGATNGLTGSLFKLPPHDSNNNQTLASAKSNLKPSSDQQEAIHMLTDLDILAAKRDKLISQLEEAHQLEECIAHRNSVIIQRILSKYYQADKLESEAPEIEEFRQFTRLKSLLLKDMHDIADRIESAEHQLIELKHS